MKPKILLIHPSFFMYGGAERQIAYMCNWLTDHDYAITILTTQMVPDMKKALKDTRYIAIPHQQTFVNFTRGILHKFDIINPHNHPAELIPVPTRMPVVWQCNEPPSYVLAGGKLSPKERMLVKRYVTKAVVISDYEKKRFESLYGFEPILNYPGVLYDFFSKEYTEPPKDKYGIKGRSPVLLETGYITWTKNQIKTVEVFNEVKKEHKKAVLVLAGHDRDPYAKMVKEKIHELKLDKDVIITGYLENDKDFRDLYKLADVYVGPFDSQGGWATTFEAIATGLPVVISDRFVGANLVKDHKLGVVSKLDDFTENVLDVLTGKNTEVDSSWIKDNLTWNKFSERYDKVFTEIYNENTMV